MHKENIESYQDFLKSCIEVIGEKIQLYAQKEIRFHLLAVTKSKIQTHTENLKQMELEMLSIQR